jgi:hypothetical protein
MLNLNNPKLNELASIIKDIPPEKVRTALIKSKAIYIRVTPTDKQSIKTTASNLRLSVSEYLTRLHFIVKDKLK